MNPQLSPPHLQEFRGSAITDSISQLNFHSTTDNEFIRHWLNWEANRRWKICPFPSGWFCHTLDPLTGDPRFWGPFKPDHPRIDPRKDKPRKYEHPAGFETLALFLQPDPQAWIQIASRYGLTVDLHCLANGEPRLGDQHFWGWVLEHPQIPVILTEGAKKAACLLSHGYVAIALPGIWNGRRKGRDESPEHLIPDLQPFATDGRPIQFCFDFETKRKTRKAVNLAILKTGRLFEQAGCLVKVITLPGPDKGVDDFIIAQGSQAFQQVYDRALSLQRWQWVIEHQAQQTHPIWLQINQPQLPIQQLRQLQQGLIVLRSPKGTGKTKVLAQLTHGSPKVCLLTHRICLGRNLAQRTLVDWKADLDRGNGCWIADGSRQTNRIGLCVDSLLAVNWEDFVGGDLIIDEVDQVLAHLLLSSTCNRDGKRPALLARLQELIKVAGRVIVASADVTDAEIHYLQALRGEEWPTFLLHNDHQPQGYPVTLLDSPSEAAIISQLLEAIQSGQKIFVTTDALASSKALIKLIDQIKELHPQLKVMVINSETSGGSNEVEFVRNINQRVTDVDVLISTPSLATGVSVEVDHFDRVFGLFYGVLTDGDIAQALARIRPPIPRVLWCAQRGKNFSKVSKSPYPALIRQALRTQWDRETRLIRTSLRPDLSPLFEEEFNWEKNPHIELWSIYTARANGSMWSLQADLVSRLEAEGNTVTVVAAEALDPCKASIREARSQAKQAFCQAVANGRKLTKQESQSLQSQEGRSPTDLYNERHTKLAEFYGTEEITPELVERDQEGRLRGQILELEALLQGSTHTIERDQDALERQAQWEQGLFPPDHPCSEVRRFVREQLGLLEVLDPEREYSTQDLQVLGEKVRQFPLDVEAHLGFKVPEDPKHASNGWIYRRLLQQLGIKVRVRREGARGHQVKLYRIDPECWAFLQEILERRQQRREGIESVLTPQTVTTTQAEVTTQTPTPITEGGWVEWLAQGGQWLVQQLQASMALLRSIDQSVTWLAPLQELRGCDPPQEVAHVLSV